MSPYLRQKDINKIWIYLSDIIAAVLLAVSSLSIVCTELGLEFAFSYIFKGGLRPGLASAWNHAADTLGSSNYIILDQYNGAGSDYGLFLGIFCLIAAVIAFLIIRSRFIPALLIFVVPPVLITVVCGLYPEPVQIVFGIAALVFAVIIMKMRGQLFPALLTAIVLFAVCMIIFFAAGGDKYWNRLTSGISGQEESLLDNIIYGHDDIIEGNLNSGKRTTESETALEVSMSHPESMYLKGFTGAEYYDNKWHDLINAEYYRYYDLMAALKEDGFFAPGQLAQSAELSSDAGTFTNEISVTNKGTIKRYAFVPYSMISPGTLENTPVKGGTEFYAGPKGSFIKYTYETCEDRVKAWTDVAGSFFTKALSADEDDQDISDYLRQESHYNKYIYEKFTELQAADRKLLLEYIGDPGDQSDGHVDYKAAINAIRSYLEDNFIYSEDPGASGDGSALRTFFETGKGYDVQFATAATLMFRFYGIPARYVGGYMISESDVSSKKAGDVIQVSGEAAHAWTEIYIDGIGFVPLEVTPEYYGRMEEADLEIGISNESLVKEFQKLYGGSREYAESDDEKSEPLDESEKDEGFLWIIPLILLVILLVIILIPVIRKLIRRLKEESERKRLFYKSGPKTSVAAVYAYMETSGFKPDDDIIKLGNYAAYSPYEITEEDRKTMLLAWERMKKEKREK